MTEQEYNNVHSLSHILTAEHALRQLVVECQPQVPSDEYCDVVNRLATWRETLFAAIAATREVDETATTD